VFAAAAVVLGVQRGLLLPDEAAVQQLAGIFDADGTKAVLVSDTVVLWSSDCVLCCVKALHRHPLVVRTHPLCKDSKATPQFSGMITA
jgi:hypothetical protein